MPSSTWPKVLRLGQLLAGLAARRPREFRHLLGTTLGAAELIADPTTDIRGLPAVTVEELCPTGDARITTLLFAGVPASVSQPEAVALGLLMRRLKARRVFEFGTYKGVSTTQLALNLELGGTVFTLDLPEDDPRYQMAISDSSERALAAEGGKGSLIPSDLLRSITYLREDSAAFDPAPYARSIDLVFVDGAHSSDYVRNDSEKGWRMLRPGGILAWHDCAPKYADVAKYVLNCGLPAQRVLFTSLAFAIKPA